ncbi:MAG: glycosyltransferase family 4 protein [Bacteroidales bacterium]|jgi:glycosyltransferase involved in cell wall biosynthesis|nr:glycosyltransferase family 4 protein [Bacteroidales bacterium]MDD4703109.1 glycosyltransferase family 4 protein [Bacteroidales bacterium]MDX9797310.1 glycosyltransferase family 4 protein [Bacteroidales bacterium]
MKILQLCYKPPFPVVDGGSMGMHTLTMGLLNNEHNVKVLAFNSFKHPVKISELPQDYIEKTKFETIFVDLKLNVFSALFSFLKNESYHVKRFYSVEMQQRLASLLKEEEFDVIQLESVFLSHYISVIRKNSKAKIVLRAPNIEHLIWEKTAQTTNNPLKKIYLNQLAQSLKKYELEMINQFDGVYTVTKVDADYFVKKGCRVPCKHVPVGIETPDFIDKDIEEKDSLFHIGSMNWIPNQQAIEWFLDNVWDMVHEKLPNVKTYFAGRAMPQWLLNLNREGVIIYGEVPDSARFICSKEIMVVPLLSGSGIRIKILEAMSLRKCVIATSQAAEGILYENNINIVIADTPEEFADSIYKCITDKEFSKKIALNAEKLISEKYNINAVAKELVDQYNQLENKE